MNAPETQDLALYVHWPFCVSKCPYCDFNSHVRESVDQDRWRDALLADLAHEARELPGRRLGSIFFGGGTPSLMPPATVAALIGAAKAHWGFAPDIEITLEANPSSVEAARFADLAAAGVNRVSLGLQSLDDKALRFLGRAHDVAEGLAALATAQRLPPGQLRPHLRAAGPERGRTGRQSSDGRSPSAPATSRSTSSPSSPARASPPSPPRASWCPPTRTRAPRSTS
jgi:coproporphyrinogen III oxidase-like Fe-S oxidoreductase